MSIEKIKAIHRILSQDFGDDLRLSAIFYIRSCMDGREKEAREFCISRCGEKRTEEIIAYAKAYRGPTPAQLEPTQRRSNKWHRT